MMLLQPAVAGSGAAGGQLVPTAPHTFAGPVLPLRGPRRPRRPSIATSAASGLPSQPRTRNEGLAAAAKPAGALSALIDAAARGARAVLQRYLHDESMQELCRCVWRVLCLSPPFCANFSTFTDRAVRLLFPTQTAHLSWCHADIVGACPTA